MLGISVLAGVQLLSASSKHFYAGYYYYDSEGWPPPHGVKGDIYTIDRLVPEGEFYAQWVTVILSYRPMYWVQVGYAKSQTTQYRLQSYFEKNDKNGYITDYFSLRYPDNIYEYWISKHPEYLDWRCGSDD